MEDYDKSFYDGKIDLFGASRKGTSQIDKACSIYVAMHPEILKQYPILQLGFNLDGTKKDLLQLLAERQQFIIDGKPIDKVNATFRAVMNFKNYVKDTPGGTKEEILSLCDYLKETGSTDEFIYDLMRYRLSNTTMTESQIEDFIQRERSAAAKIRKEKEEMELQPEKEKTIQDEVGDNLKPKTKEELYEEQQAEAKWMNRLQVQNDNTAKKQDGAKKTLEVVKLIHDLDSKQTNEQIQDKNQQTQEETPNNGRGD